MRPCAYLMMCFLSLGIMASTDTVAAPVESPTAALQAEMGKVGVAAFTSPDYKPGTVRHVVLLRFKDELPAARRQALIEAFLSLKTHSLHNGRQVIAAIETGPQISGEGVDRGLQQAFLLTFKSQGDRNYFIGSPIVTKAGFFDPAHDAFKKQLIPALAAQGIVGFDYPVTSAQPPAP